MLDAILAVHVRGTFNVTRAAWPHMLAQNYGRVVLTGSTGMLGMPDNLSYATAKSAGVVEIDFNKIDAEGVHIYGMRDGETVSPISPAKPIPPT